MDINAYDLDWKSILIKKYRNYDLDEIDCMVLFVSDAVLHVEPKTLITKEILSPYMVDGDRIDDSLSRLMEKVCDLLQMPMLKQNPLFQRTVACLREEA